MDILLVVNIVGWVGSACIILAYVFVSIKRWDAESFVYQLVNLVGGVCLIVNTVYLGAFPSAFVNTMWVGIALFALWRLVRKR